MHKVAEQDVDQWLCHEHEAVDYNKAKAPAYVVDGGLPSECSQCNTLVWAGPDTQVTVQAGNAWLRWQFLLEDWHRHVQGPEFLQLLHITF